MFHLYCFMCTSTHFLGTLGSLAAEKENSRLQKLVDREREKGGKGDKLCFRGQEAETNYTSEGRS